MSQVSRLHHAEAARVDRGRLVALVHDHGPQGAERVMGRAMETLAVRLNKAERVWRRGHVVDLCRDAGALAKVADDVGLVGLAEVARVVSGLAMSGDAAAIGATVARMMRIGEASLMNVWDLGDQMP